MQSSILLIMKWWRLLPNITGIYRYISRTYSVSYKIWARSVALCFIMVLSSVVSGSVWSIYPYLSGLVCRWGNPTIASLSAKESWVIWVHVTATKLQQIADKQAPFMCISIWIYCIFYRSMHVSNWNTSRSEFGQSEKYCQYTGAITYDQNVIIGFDLLKYYMYTQLFLFTDQSW